MSSITRSVENELERGIELKLVIFGNYDSRPSPCTNDFVNYEYNVDLSR
jgi:hypothetical protein